MQKLNDELLIAYLDGELDAAAAAEVALMLEHDPVLGERARRLVDSAALLRGAFDSVLHEPVPERLIAATRGEGKVAAFPGARSRRARQVLTGWRAWIAVPIAASVASLVIGGSLGYLAGTSPIVNPAEQQNLNLASGSWLDNIAGYHRLFVTAGANDAGLVDIPGDGQQSAGTRKVTAQLPPDFHLPNLKPWGLAFQGVRFLIIEGRPATQLFYTTDNKALGPLTVVVASTTRPDIAPTFDRRGDLNLLYWRHQGHVYALVGSADIGYLWNIHNDLAWQLDAI